MKGKGKKREAREMWTDMDSNMDSDSNMDGDTDTDRVTNRKAET